MARNKKRDIDLIRSKAEAIKATHTTLHARYERVRSTVRLRLQQEWSELPVKDLATALSSRGLAIVHQCRAFAETSNYHYTVKPFDDTIEESAETSRLERWLGGVRGALTETTGLPYSDFFYHYFESGAGILRTLFDSRRAAAGQFPFYITAPDPLSVSLLQSSGHVIAAVEEEQQLAGVLYDELMTEYEAAPNPFWRLPKRFVDVALKSPTTSVTVMRYTDKTHETLFVDNELVWDRPHFLSRCPYDVAFCVDIPSDKPEEWGMGVAYPILSMLEQESQLFDKYASDAEIGARRLVLIQLQDGSWRVDQAAPGNNFKGARQVVPLDYDANHELLDKLLSIIDTDVQRMTLPAVAFGPLNLQLSGFAYMQAMSGLNAKISHFAQRPQVALGRHSGYLLSALEYFADPARAKILAPGNEKKYMESFSVLSKGKDASVSEKKVVQRIAVKGSDVKGHTTVEVELTPNVPADENAKVDRALRLIQGSIPAKWVIMNVLSPDQPEELLEDYYDEQLRVNIPEYGQFYWGKVLQAKMKRNKELGKEWMEWGQKLVMARQEQMATTQPQGGMPNEMTGMPAEQPTLPAMSPADAMAVTPGMNQSIRQTAQSVGANPEDIYNTLGLPGGQSQSFVPDELTNPEPPTPGMIGI